MKILLIGIFAVLTVSALSEINVQEEKHHLQKREESRIGELVGTVVALLLVGGFLFYVVPFLLQVAVPIVLVSTRFVNFA